MLSKFANISASGFMYIYCFIDSILCTIIFLQTFSIKILIYFSVSYNLQKLEDDVGLLIDYNQNID